MNKKITVLLMVLASLILLCSGSQAQMGMSQSSAQTSSSVSNGYLWITGSGDVTWDLKSPIMTQKGGDIMMASNKLIGTAYVQMGFPLKDGKEILLKISSGGFIEGSTVCGITGCHALDESMPSGACRRCGYCTGACMEGMPCPPPICGAVEETNCQTGDVIKTTLCVGDTTCKNSACVPINSDSISLDIKSSAFVDEGKGAFQFIGIGSMSYKFNGQSGDGPAYFDGQGTIMLVPGTSSQWPWNIQKMKLSGQSGGGIDFELTFRGDLEETTLYPPAIKPNPGPKLK